jgi:hypothetical protein
MVFFGVYPRFMPSMLVLQKYGEENAPKVKKKGRLGR